MPILAAWLGSLFTSIATFFAAYITKRLAIIAAAIALMVSITATFFAALRGLLTGVTAVLPDAVVIGASWFLPSNAIPCMSIVLSALALRWLYNWHIKIIQLKLF